MSDDPLEAFLRAAEPSVKTSFVAQLLDDLDEAVRTSAARTEPQMREHARGLLQGAAARVRAIALEAAAGRTPDPDDGPTPRP